MQKIESGLVPFFPSLGDVDKVVPLERNIQAIYDCYRALGGPMQLIVVPGKGHQVDAGFFESEAMLEFLLTQVGQR